MSWHFVERWLQKVNQHSTLIGKFWITFIIIFRIVVVSSVGDRVYSDEQSEFKCNTMQVGCPNVCFNKFSPISHIRFWSFQIVMVTTPSIVFMVYSAHQIKKKPSPKDKVSLSAPTTSPNNKVELGKEGAPLEEGEKKNWKKSQVTRQASMDAPEAVEQRKTVIQEMFGEDKAAFSQHYVLYGLSVVMRTGVEVVFIYLQYKMFGFQVHELYKCTGKPCPNTVDCFVSRPMEKTIFLWFMFLIAVICFFLNVFELQYLFWQFCVRRPRIKRRRKKQLKRSTISESQTLNIVDAEILESGTFNGTYNATAPPAYRGGTEMYDVENIHVAQLEGVPGTPMGMGFNMDDVMHPENQPTSKYHGYQLNAPSVSTTSNNYTVPAPNDVAGDQPYLANPRVENSKQKGYYNYV